MSDRPDGHELARCPVCNGEVAAEASRPCVRCETPHHRECWDYVGDCAIFGCRPAGTGHDARLPARAEDRREVAGLARWYTRLFRAHWWGFLGMTLPVAWMPVLMVAAFLLRAEWVVGFPMIAMVLGAAGYFLLLVPLLGTRWALQRRLGAALQAPRTGTTALLESMEMTGSSNLLLRLVEHGPLVYAALVGLAYAAGGGAPVLFWAVFAIPLLYGVRYATRQRVLMIEALQNRLLASMKKG